MISESTVVNVIDNSGVLEGRCIKVLLPKSYYGRRIGKIGDIIILSVTKILNGSKIKKGDIIKALIVRTKRIQDGNRVSVVTHKKEQNMKGIVYGKRSSMSGYRKSFGDNSVVLVKLGTKNTREITPIGSRIKGPLSETLKIDKYTNKIISICI